MGMGVGGSVGRRVKGWQIVSGQGDQEDWGEGGGRGGLWTLVLGGPIYKKVYLGGAPPVWKHKASFVLVIRPITII